MSINRLRVVTLNVWALPWGLSRFNQIRLEMISRQLNQVDADIFAFQEVWTHEARDSLVASGKKAGYLYSWHRQNIWKGSGLLLLSRLPITDTQFIPFSLSGLPQNIHHGDWWSGKGIALHQIQHPAGKVMLVNTHLLARYVPLGQKDIYFPMRVAEVVQLAGVLASQKNAVVALGDFNFLEEHDEYQILLGLTGLTDVAASLNHRQHTRPASSPARKPGGRVREDARLDYVFTRPGQSLRLKPLKAERIFDEVIMFEDQTIAVSDHAGVCADFIPETETAQAHDIEPMAIDNARKWLNNGLSQAKERQQKELTQGAIGGVSAISLGMGSRLKPIKRRQFLRAGLTAVAGLSVAGSGLLLSSSQYFVEDEIKAYHDMIAILDSLQSSNSIISRSK